MMKSISTWKQELTKGAHAARLAALYCCTPDETPAQAARYAAVLDPPVTSAARRGVSLCIIGSRSL